MAVENEDGSALDRYGLLKQWYRLITLAPKREGRRIDCIHCRHGGRVCLMGKINFENERLLQV